MKFLFLSSFLLVLSLFYQNVSADEEFFKKSIFRELEQKRGQFSSEIQLVFTILNRTMSVNETYSFGLGAGWLNTTLPYDDPLLGEHPLSVITAYSNSSSDQTSLYEYYSTERHRHCESLIYGKSHLRYHLSKWAPTKVFSSKLELKLNFTILGKLRTNQKNL